MFNETALEPLSGEGTLDVTLEGYEGKSYLIL
jgi:hypothetical protein